MPSLASSGVAEDDVSNGRLGIEPGRAYPDVRSFRRKFGVLIPATNTSMESELWSLIFGAERRLDGVGLHTTPVSTPRPVLRDVHDLGEYQRQFLSGLEQAVSSAVLSGPDALIMGMSLEHILFGLDAIEHVMTKVEAQSSLPWIGWHKAAPAALARFGARRLGLLTPFDSAGNRNAARMFADLGFEVVTSVGFACANARAIAHVPDSAKERAIVEHLATRAHRLDAVVQCGTNMSLLAVSERVEPRLGIPILGINATLFWHALRQSGIDERLLQAGRLLREH